MQETNRTDTTITDNPVLNIGVPTIGIDLRRILLAVRSEIPHRKLLFSSNSRADVFVPTLRERFWLVPYKDYLLIKARKKIKIPMLMDGPVLSTKIIDVVVAWIEHLGINDKINIEP
jgi:hypothetical protein